MARSTTIEEVELLPGGFRNFAGNKTKYNREGNRVFNVAFSEEVAKGLTAEGWNVKVLEPRDEDEKPKFFLKVSLRFKPRTDAERRRQPFDARDPRVVMVTSRGKTRLSEDEVSIIDWADVLKADIRVNQYAYEMDDGGSGVSAYCDSLFVTIAEDNLENKYFDVPDQTPGGYLAADDYDEDDD